jgi:hypothetical protein
MLLEEITSAAIQTGLDPDGAADVRAVRWIGDNAVAVTWVDVARAGLLMRSDEVLTPAKLRPVTRRALGPPFTRIVSVLQSGRGG